MKTRVFLILLMAICIFAPLSVKAAGEKDDILFIEIRIMPEYDQPGVLVIYFIQLDPTGIYPTDVEFQIPAHVGTPNAVAYLAPANQLISVPYERIVEGNSAILRFITQSPVIQIEYYDPNLLVDDDIKKYTLSQTMERNIGELIISILQPVGAINLVSTPPMGKGEVDDQGLVHYQTSMGQIGIDQPIVVQLQYEKKTDQLFVESNTKPAVLQVVSWVIQIGAVLSGIGLFSWWVFNRREVMGSPDFDNNIIATCPNCQNNLKLDESYCAKCGARVEQLSLSESAPSSDLKLFNQLSEREIQVIQLIGRGLTSQEIGEILLISPKTVSRHRERLTKKLGLNSTAELIRFGIRVGIIDP